MSRGKEEEEEIGGRWGRSKGKEEGEYRTKRRRKSKIIRRGGMRSGGEEVKGKVGAEERKWRGKQERKGDREAANGSRRGSRMEGNKRREKGEK